jgi:formylglycine-generating enzyme required for sulfatase activity
LRIEGVKLSEITEILDRDAPNAAHFVVFDACRNELRGTRGAKGFAAVSEKNGMVIAFASAPGTTASDGGNDGGPYARALAKEIVRQGLDHYSVLFNVREALVNDPEAGGQFPWWRDGLRQRIRFAAGGAPQAPVSDAAREWQAVQNTQSQAVLDEFINQFSDSVFARYARARLQELRGETEVAVGVFPERPAAEPAPCDGVEVSLSPGGSKCIKPGSGETFQDCWKDGGVTMCGPQMAVVPKGKYLRGSPDDEKDRFSNEGPRRDVTIAAPFAVGRTHVTRGEFAAFVKATNHKTEGGCYTWTGSEWKQQTDRSWQSPGFDQTDDHPVVCVNWEDAQAFAKWVSEKTNKVYRLMSEAEAEYAARGITKIDPKQPRYFFGNEEKELCSYANGGDQTAKEKFSDWTVAPCKDGYVYTAPVARFKANAFGLYDVHGNVWSWTQDCWNDSYKAAPTDGSAWTAGDCSRRVLRGGSWYSRPWFLRAAIRYWDTSDFRYYFYGFRLARTLNP